MLPVKGIKSTISDALSAPSISSAWSTIKSKLTDIFEKVRDKATEMKEKVSSAVGNLFSGVVDKLKSPWNSIADAINGIIEKIINAVNGVINTVNLISVTVPQWVPGIGGKRFGFNIPTIKKYPRVPRLAQGAVIPPNAPFTAVLGDQKSGNNLELPESLLRQIVREESGGNGNYTFVAELDGNVLFKKVIKKAQLQKTQTGHNPFEMAMG